MQVWLSKVKTSINTTWAGSRLNWRVNTDKCGHPGAIRACILPLNPYTMLALRDPDNFKCEICLVKDIRDAEVEVGWIQTGEKISRAEEVKDSWCLSEIVKSKESTSCLYGDLWVQ